MPFAASEQDYWSNQPDLGVDIVSEALSRNRFLEIKSSFHLIDNHQLDECSSKVEKVLPLYNKFNESLTSFGIFHEDLSIDESMVPYYGRHSCKMFIRGKPICFWYKLWCLCGQDGYPYYLSIYTAKDNSESGPLGSRVAMQKVGIIEQFSQPERQTLFFDDFFTSYDFLSTLSDINMKSIGTIRENRTSGPSSSMKSAKEMKKSARGT